ncbi:4592_t:CDS:1, partial [Entrophospora sp. SA101]
KIISSNEGKKFPGNKSAKNKKMEEVIAWIKEINSRLQKEDPLGNKILLSYSRLGREAKRLRKIKQLKENKEHPKSN